MVGSASEYNQHGEHLDHTGRPYAAGSPDPRTRPAVFVDKGQQPHPCAVIEPQMHEVVDPHMLLPRRPQTHSRAVIEPQTPSLGLLHRHLQPFPSPYPLHTPVVHMPAAMPQKGGDPTVAVPAELTGQLHDPLGQGILILIGDRLISPCGRRMTRHTAGASPRNPKSAFTWSRHPRRREGLRILPRTPPAGSGCPASGPPPPSSGGRSPTPDASGAWPGRS